MGRLLLLLVLATGIGGAVLTLSSRDTLSAFSQTHSDSQADVLSREIAEAGQNVALTHMIGAGGFSDPTRAAGTEQEYEGGDFQIEYVPASATGGAAVTEATLRVTEATLRVTGSYGGASHTIESTYRYDPMDAPGPLWLDVPYATTAMANTTRVSGSADDHPITFDRRKHDELQLESFLPMADIQSDLVADASRAGSAAVIPQASDWTGDTGLLEDLNVEDVEGLYMAAITSMSGTDATKPTAYTVDGTETWGSTGDAITRVQGDLSVTGKLTGNGALVVEGSLLVTGEMTWNGIVILRSEADVLDIELDGKVRINGMMAVSHNTFPPGGHLDVSVYRDADGMLASAPQGSLLEQLQPWRSDPRNLPFHQHTHAFDVTPTTAPRGDHVYFLEGGNASRHEAQVQLKGLLDDISSTEVYWEIGNPDKHGFSMFGLDVDGGDGTDGPLLGSLRSGFDTFASLDSEYKSQPFAADDLEDFNVDVSSLRSLRKAFDDPSCTDWPICIGQSWDRRGALALRLVRASDDRRLYEATMYWHMREDEEEAVEAEEQAWREKIMAGEAFGTHVRMGENVRMDFSMGEIEELTEKMGFDGPEIDLLSSQSYHQTAAETRALSQQGNAGMSGGNGNTDNSGIGTGSGAGAEVMMCSRKGDLKPVPSEDVSKHLRHGCTYALRDDGGWERGG